jgi:hypothetical protein
MNQWVNLYETIHMMNYIHIIGSGHLTYFAKKYGNQYHYSQQGWEVLNQVLKHYYFNNTNHGGLYGNGGKSADGTYSGSAVCGDHCRSLMRLCQRPLMWKLGIGEAYFLKKDNRERKSGYLPASVPNDCDTFKCHDQIMFDVI